MIVFPVLNFVLALILTSLTLVKSQDCGECKQNNGVKVVETTEFRRNNDSTQSPNKVESVDRILFEDKNKRNVK